MSCVGPKHPFNKCHWNSFYVPTSRIYSPPSCLCRWSWNDFLSWGVQSRVSVLKGNSRFLKTRRSDPLIKDLVITGYFYIMYNKIWKIIGVITFIFLCPLYLNYYIKLSYIGFIIKFNISCIFIISMNWKKHGSEVSGFTWNVSVV